MSDWRKLLALEDVGKPTLDEIHQAYKRAVDRLGETTPCEVRKLNEAVKQARRACGYDVKP